jgi:hypothetical protein
VKTANALLAATLFAVSAANSFATTIWSGPTISFDKPGGVDGTLSQNQDELTPEVIFARGDIQGLYNAATESGFTHNLSPADTLWGNGTTANIGAISFNNWNAWFQANGGPSVVGKPAVVELVNEGIYLDLTFTEWDTGHTGSNPGFAYERSTPSPAPEPSTLALLGGGLALGWAARRWRRCQVSVRGSR